MRTRKADALAISLAGKPRVLMHFSLSQIWRRRAPPLCAPTIGTVRGEVKTVMGRVVTFFLT
jgi:hypothetical protein